ncbi:MAG: CU044_5270 family protein, partial [Solirubrobacteraceae bacterium]
AACVAATLAIVAGTGSSAPPRAAAAVLQRLARVASGQRPVSAPAPGHYLYVDSTQAGESVQGGCSTLVAEQRQIWISANGSGRVLESTGQGSFFSTHDRLVCRRSHSILLNSRATSDTWWARGCYSIGDASYLRGSFRDPKTLLQKLAEIAGGPPGSAEAFMHIGDFLRESDASPALRAAIYRAAATIPGARLLGPVSDRLGRPGIGIALTSHRWTSELILDPHDSALLAEQTTFRGQLHGWGCIARQRL